MLGIEALTATILASNESSVLLFEEMGFVRWGFMPRNAQLEGVEMDPVPVGRRLAELNTRPSLAIRGSFSPARA